MVPVTNLQAVLVGGEAVDGPNDVICIVQDETNDDNVLTRYQVNLPRCTSILDLYKRTAQQFCYEENSFLLVWKNMKGGQNNQVEEMVLRDGIESLTLEDVCQPPEKKKQRFFLRQKDDVHPIRIK